MRGCQGYQFEEARNTLSFWRTLISADTFRVSGERRLKLTCSWMNCRKGGENPPSFQTQRTINPVTAPASKVSGLKDAGTCLQRVYFPLL